MALFIQWYVVFHRLVLNTLGVSCSLVGPVRLWHYDVRSTTLAVSSPPLGYLTLPKLGPLLQQYQIVPDTFPTARLLIGLPPRASGSPHSPCPSAVAGVGCWSIPYEPAAIESIFFSVGARCGKLDVVSTQGGYAGGHCVASWLYEHVSRLDPWTVQPVDSRYTDYATRPTVIILSVPKLHLKYGTPSICNLEFLKL
jgi:hypothetical protein